MVWQRSACCLELFAHYLGALGVASETTAETMVCRVVAAELMPADHPLVAHSLSATRHRLNQS